LLLSNLLLVAQAYIREMDLTTRGIVMSPQLIHEAKELEGQHRQKPHPVERWSQAELHRRYKQEIQWIASWVIEQDGWKTWEDILGWIQEYKVDICQAQGRCT
jgi:hypothetical protein